MENRPQKRRILKTDSDSKPQRSDYDSDEADDDSQRRFIHIIDSMSESQPSRRRFNADNSNSRYGERNSENSNNYRSSYTSPDKNRPTNRNNPNYSDQQGNSHRRNYSGPARNEYRSNDYRPHDYRPNERRQDSTGHYRQEYNRNPQAPNYRQPRSGEYPSEFRNRDYYSRSPNSMPERGNPRDNYRHSRNNDSDNRSPYAQRDNYQRTKNVRREDLQRQNVPNKKQNRSEKVAAKSKIAMPKQKKQRMYQLIKVLKKFKLASPKICSEIISDGRVSVNGEVIRNPNFSAVSTKDKIVIDNCSISELKKTSYFLINKQKNVTGSLERNQANIYRQFKTDNEKMYFPLGCLEKSTFGLVFATDDPEFRFPDMPQFSKVSIEYCVKIVGKIAPKMIKKVQSVFSKSYSGKINISALKECSRHTWISVSGLGLRGKQLRSALKQCQIEILSFERCRIGAVTSDFLQRGMWTGLSKDDLQLFFQTPDNTTNILAESQESKQGQMKKLPRNYFGKKTVSA